MFGVGILIYERKLKSISNVVEKINSNPIDFNKLTLVPWRKKQALQVLLLKIQAIFMNRLLQSRD